MQRTLRFAQHLPKFGWRPIVLTATPRAYESTAQMNGNEIPEDLEVHRAFGLDTARQLSLFGRYPGFLTVPDRWTTWRFCAARSALQIIRKRSVDAIWSTFPIATAHLVGLTVARRSGLPWVAEFRDPMWQGDYPPDPRINSAWKTLETEVFGLAQRVVVTTPGAATEYAQRFPRFDRTRIALIANGYDEESFRRASESLPTAAVSACNRRGRITLLHSGIVYRSERDPTQLFYALAAMKRKGLVSASSFQLVLRASGDDPGYRRDLISLGIQDIVHLAPAIDYLAALQEMLTTDGLLILQASNCNAQVPAKLYEYLRANRPIAALTDPAGDTAKTLESAGVRLIARLDSAEDIERTLLIFMDQIRNGTWPRTTHETIARYSREAQAGQLARLLDDVAATVVRAHAIVR
jgi:glycosyltransferase involved in cell wall biosynthesis